MAKPTVGGQAVIEGVMMMNGENLATAVRKGRKIVVNKEKHTPLRKKIPLFGVPFFRGAANLIEMMYVGTKALIFSANQVVEDEEDEEELTPLHITITVAVALLMSIGLFVLLPYFLTTILGIEEVSKPILFNFVDGIIKMIVLLAYIYGIGFMPDIRRVFQYHGAEHKTIHAYEHGRPLVAKEIQKFSTKHSRCGTSFLVIVVLVGVIVFSLIPTIVNYLYPSIHTLATPVRFAIYFLARVLMLPVVAGISYEWLKFSPNLGKRSFLAGLNAPGIWVQNLTTREPTDEQVRVAVASLKAVLEEEKPKRKAKKKTSTKKKKVKVARSATKKSKASVKKVVKKKTTKKSTKKKTTKKTSKVSKK